MKKLLIFLIPFCLFAQGKATHGSSLLFNGSTSFVNCGNGVTLQNTPLLTVVFWAKGNNNTGTQITKGYSNWEIDINLTSFQGFVGLDVSPNYYALNGMAHGINPDRWNQFIYMFDYTNDTVWYYVNSVFKKAEYVANMAQYNETRNLNVGRRVESDGSQYCLGNLAGVSIYKRKLPLSEIIWLYNHPEKIYSTDSLKLWLPLSEFTGTVAGDSSGNANNGTISGATWNIDTPVWGASCPKP